MSYALRLFPLEYHVLDLCLFQLLSTGTVEWETLEQWKAGFPKGWKLERKTADESSSHDLLMRRVVLGGGSMLS